MYLDDIKIGSVINIENVVIEKDEMIDFSEKYNPARIHTDEEYAKTTRFGQLLAPGMLTFMAVWRKYIPLDFAGGEFIAGTSTSLEWTAPVFAGDVLRCAAEVTDKTFRNEHNGILTVNFNIYNQSDTLVLKAEVKSVVRRRGK